MDKTQIITIASIACVSITLAVIFIVVILVQEHQLKKNDLSGYNIQLKDLFASKTAEQYGINNTTNNETIILNLKYLITKTLEPAYKKIPYSFNSGWRCDKVNKIVGGEDDSQHKKGEAADITTGTTDGNKRLFEYIRDNLPFDQLINEKNYSWVHVSNKRIGINRKQILIR